MIPHENSDIDIHEIVKMIACYMYCKVKMLPSRKIEILTPHRLWVFSSALEKGDGPPFRLLLRKFETMTDQERAAVQGQTRTFSVNYIRARGICLDPQLFKSRYAEPLKYW